MNEKFVRILSAGFGSGFSPLAPGTAGTVVGIPLYWLFSFFSWPIWLISILAFTCLAWYVSDEAERLFGRKDAPCIVIDEIAGFQWTLFLVTPTVSHVALGFVLFRLFDIVKPPPIRQLDAAMKNGIGVMLDDLLAAGYALLVLALAARLMP